MSRIDAYALKAALRPLDFYRAELPALKIPSRLATWIDGALCPFHADKHAGSFKLNVHTGAYRCFACGAHGADVIAFTMERHHMTFPEALRAIADAHGIYAPKNERPGCNRAANRARR